jgi:hypothetical protein
MTQEISFEDFLDNVISRCGKLSDWLGERDGIAAEYRSKFSYHAKMTSSWKDAILSAAIAAKRGEISRIECLKRMVAGGTHVVFLDRRMPQYMTAMTYDMSLMILSDVDCMWVHCKVSHLSLEAASNIEEMIDFVEKVKGEGTITNRKLLSSLEEIPVYLKQRLSDAKKISRNDVPNIYELVELAQSQFSWLNESVDEVRHYAEKLILRGNNGLNIYIRLMDLTYRVRYWYKLTLEAIRYKQEVTNDGSDSKSDMVEEINRNAHKLLKEVEFTFQRMLKILDKNQVVPDESEWIHRRLRDAIVEALSTIRLVADVNFIFSENRKLIVSLMSIAIDVGGRSLSIYATIKAFEELSFTTYMNYGKLKRLSKKAHVMLDKIYEEIKKISPSKTDRNDLP